MTSGDRETDTAAWLPQPGERALSIGQTGSGKTSLNIFLMERLRTTPIIIYDTKEEPKFERMPRSIVTHNIAETSAAVDNETIDHIIFRPDISYVSDPTALDALLMHHYESYRGVDAYIDELYSFHRSGRAGPGLIGIYTRGRSRGITTISSSQQPRWISGFSISEAQLFYIFHLNREDDRKAVAKGTGMMEMPNPPPHHFWLFRAGSENPTLVKPILLDPRYDTGYTDAQQSVDTEPEPTTDIGHVWL